MQAGTIVGNLASAIGITTEDAALVADLKAGSEEAFAILIAQYHQPLYSLIARSLNDPADAADITQEVFIKVFRSIRGFHGESSLRTWLYRIALHEASNQRRWWSRHKKQEITIDSPYESSAETKTAVSASRRRWPTSATHPSTTPPRPRFASASKPRCGRCRRPSARSLSCARSRASLTKRSPRSST